MSNDVVFVGSRVARDGIYYDINPNQPRYHMPVGDCFILDVNMSNFTEDMCWWFDLREERFIEIMTEQFNAKIHTCDNGNRRMYFDNDKDPGRFIEWAINEWMPGIKEARNILNNGQKLLPDNDVIKQRTK